MSIDKFFIGFVVIVIIGLGINEAFATGSIHHNNNTTNIDKSKTIVNKNTKNVSKSKQGQRQDQSQVLDNDNTVSNDDYSKYREAAQSAITSVASSCHSAAAAQGRGFGLSITGRAEFCDHISLAQFKLALADGECTAPVDVGLKGAGNQPATLTKYCYRQREALYQEALAHIADAEATTKPGLLKRGWKKLW